ncbi:MAG TPA: lysophospholipid acyltransferase family protein [Verrucomicrobiae bacterium]|nr:lysophospholipid acyltransferase family protein [Verrucomicrobiae bacterium]
MHGAFQHPLRVGVRLLWMFAELLYIGSLYPSMVLLCAGETRLIRRARWLQYGSRRLLRIFGGRLAHTGQLPGSGLLVCNHLSYLDVLALSAISPCAFVAKQEVRSWPVFGWFARLGGTLFTDRQRRMEVGLLTRDLKSLLDQNLLVVLFPEGTSSDGRTVLPFKSALLQPAVDSRHPVSAAAIAYGLEDGDAGEEVCYWKDMTFVPHLLNLLAKKRITISLRFARFSKSSASRKELARHLHAEVSMLRSHSAVRVETTCPGVAAETAFSTMEPVA